MCRKNALKDEIQVKIVSGGITNQLYRLIWMDKSLLVRIYGENTEILIDRQTENGDSPNSLSDFTK